MYARESVEAPEPMIAVATSIEHADRLEEAIAQRWPGLEVRRQEVPWHRTGYAIAPMIWVVSTGMPGDDIGIAAFDDQTDANNGAYQVRQRYGSSNLTAAVPNTILRI